MSAENIEKQTFKPEILSDYKDYASASGKRRFGLWDYLSVRGDFELAAAFTKLFWPDFKNVEDCILLAEQYEQETFQEWKQKLNGDRKQIESVINHVHIYDLFLNTKNENLDPAIYETIATAMMKCWKCALSEAFPGKKFKIEYETEPEEYGPTLTFFQEEH